MKFSNEFKLKTNIFWNKLDCRYKVTTEILNYVSSKTFLVLRTNFSRLIESHSVDFKI